MYLFFLFAFVDFQMRCPHGKKVKIYKRAKLEKFAHYLMKDGLISKLSMYENRECKFISSYIFIITENIYLVIITIFKNVNFKMNIILRRFPKVTENDD